MLLAHTTRFLDRRNASPALVGSTKTRSIPPRVPSAWQGGTLQTSSCLPCPLNEYCERGVARGATCPFTHSTTAPATDGGGGATHLADCICKADYYLSNLTCVTCPNGADCIKEGARLESLPLEAGYWRSHALSEEVRLCFTADACIGSTRLRADTHAISNAGRHVHH